MEDQPSIVVALDEADTYRVVERLSGQYIDVKIASFPSFYLARNKVLEAKNLKGIVVVAGNDLSGEDSRNFKMLVEAGLSKSPEVKIVIIYTTFIRVALTAVLGELLKDKENLENNEKIVLIEQTELVRKGVKAVLGGLFK